MVDDERLVARDGGANEPVAERKARRIVARRIANRVGGSQFAATLVEKVDRQRLERDQPADEDWNLREELVEVQDRRDLTAQIEEGLDDLMLGGGRCRQLVCRRKRGVVLFSVRGCGISGILWVKIALGCVCCLELYLQVPACRRYSRSGRHPYAGDQGT